MLYVSGLFENCVGTEEFEQALSFINETFPVVGRYSLSVISTEDDEFVFVLEYKDDYYVQVKMLDENRVEYSLAREIYELNKQIVTIAEMNGIIAQWEK